MILSASLDDGVRAQVAHAAIRWPLTRCGGALAKNKMKITNLDFNDAETAALYAMAGATLKKAGVGRKEAMDMLAKETPQNLVRLALDFKRRKRGGARPNTGNRKK